VSAADPSLDAWRSLVDLDRLAAWMDARGLEGGPIEEAARLAGGTQNILLKFRRGERWFMLRRPPLSPRMNGSETMRREARVLAALADTDEELKAAQYKVLQQWQNVYNVPALKVLLPDTFGTTQFLRDAPEWVRHWTGGRPDSKKPIEGGEELLEYWQRVDPEHVADKLIIFSDGMDVQLPGRPVLGEDIPTVHAQFRGRVRTGFGWGTNLTNDFVGCHPADPPRMRPISLVCKVKDADGRAAVKLSDNYGKATGPAEEVERYRRVFGSEGCSDIPVTV